MARADENLIAMSQETWEQYRGQAFSYEQVQLMPVPFPRCEPWVGKVMISGQYVVTIELPTKIIPSARPKRS